MIVNYTFSIVITKSNKRIKIYLFLPIIINIGLLLYYKYSNFTISNINHLLGKEFPLLEIMLPIGISFFTFQQIAYLVAIYHGELENHRLLDYCIFILYFPKILMGPLTDPVEFMDMINDTSLKKINWDNIACGIKIFSLGLFKKVMLADVFAKAVNWGFTDVGIPTSADWFFIMLFYTFEIYFDFSGYSDMAVGSSLLLNITLPINFDSPYKALSIRDFWRRWHISLTNFFTKYIYIPLGGNKKGLAFACTNTMIIFFISGVWHGANWTFILWGLLHGVFHVFDRLTKEQQEKIFSPARWLYSFTVVNVLWLLFRSDSITQWISIMKKMLHFQSLSVSEDLITSFHIPEASFISDILRLPWSLEESGGFWMMVYAVIALGICLIFANNYRKLKEHRPSMMIISAVAFIWGFISLSLESIFVYFNF